MAADEHFNRTESGYQREETARSSQENMNLSDSIWYWNVIARLLGCRLHSSWPWKRDATVSEVYALMMMMTMMMMMMMEPASETRYHCMSPLPHRWLYLNSTLYFTCFVFLSLDYPKYGGPSSVCCQLGHYKFFDWLIDRSWQLPYR